MRHDREKDSESEFGEQHAVWSVGKMGSGVKETEN